MKLRKIPLLLLVLFTTILSYGDSDVSQASRFPKVMLGCASGVRKEHVLTALEAGYRAFDTAQNEAWGYLEADVGEAIEESPVQRELVFLQTKVSPYNYKRNLRDSIEASFRNLRTSYIDSVILHTADPGWKGAYRVLEEYVRHDRIHHIGVSNFDEKMLMELLEFATIKPSVVQNWNDVLHQDTQVRDICTRFKITYQAYSSLGNQWFRRLRQSETKPFARRPFVSNIETLRSIAATRKTDVPGLVYRWQLQSNIAVIATSRDSARQRTNMETVSNEHFVLSSSEIQEIEALNGRVNEVIQMRRVSFSNRDVFVLDLFWLDKHNNNNTNNSKFIWKGEIHPDRVMDIVTYVGHIFLLKQRMGDDETFHNNRTVVVSNEPLHQTIDWNGPLDHEL